MKLSFQKIEAIGQNLQHLQPQGNYVTIEMNETEKETQGGILLPDQVAEKDKQIVARVIAVGTGQRSITTGEFMPLMVQAGDLVLVNKHGPWEGQIGGHKIYLVAEGDILAVIDEAAIDAALAESERTAAAAAPAADPALAGGGTVEVENEAGRIVERPSGLLVVEGAAG